MERANVPISSIQRILGHENRAPTEIYLHSIGNAEREAMEVFELATQDAMPAEIHTQSLTQDNEKVRPKNLTPWKFMAPPARLERATHGLGIHCSIHN
jgi:hypothetical protein